MRRCFFDSSNGRFISFVDSRSQEVLDINTPEGSVFVDGNYDINYYLDGEVVVKQPEQPSTLHMFDFQTKTWIFSSSAIKGKRASLLEQSDWTDTLSSKTRLGDNVYNQWQVYRQALRDIPQQSGYPQNVVWPTPPQ
jgi:hypothetical protein